jgi:hypothetical protein
MIGELQQLLCQQRQLKQQQQLLQQQQAQYQQYLYVRIAFTLDMKDKW